MFPRDIVSLWQNFACFWTLVSKMKSRVDEQKKSDNKLILRCLRDDLSLSVPLMKKENFIKRFLNQLELFFDIPSTVICKRRNATETKRKGSRHAKRNTFKKQKAAWSKDGRLISGKATKSFPRQNSTY